MPYAEVHDEWNDEVNDDETNLTDLLTDLRHWAKANGLNFEAAVTMSETHFNSEEG